MFVAGPQLGFFVLRWIVLRFHWIGSLGFSSAQEEKKKVPKNTSPLTCGPDVLSWDVRRHAACGHKRETVILQNIWWFIKTLTDQITTHLNQRDCNTIFFFCLLVAMLHLHHLQKKQNNTKRHHAALPIFLGDRRTTAAQLEQLLRLISPANDDFKPKWLTFCVMHSSWFSKEEQRLLGIFQSAHTFHTPCALQQEKNKRVKPKDNGAWSFLFFRPLCSLGNDGHQQAAGGNAGEAHNRRAVWSKLSGGRR